MSRLIVERIMCDIGGEVITLPDDSTEGFMTVDWVWDGASLTFDCCAACEDKMLALPVTELVSRSASVPTPKKKQTRPRVATSDTLVCPDCGSLHNTDRGLKVHVTRNHTPGGANYEG